MKLKLGLLFFTTISLSSCAHLIYEKDMASGDFVQAKQIEVKKQIIEKYIPIPVHNKSYHIPSKKDLKEKPELTKEKAVSSANKASQVYPSSSDFFNSMMTYQYMQGSLYTIYTAPMKITDIVLEKGEKIISQAAGDTLRWKIASTYSGSGKNLYWHILIKPKKAGLNNTFIVTTNKRTYHMILQSVNNDAYMVSVRWDYPGDMVAKFNGANLNDMSTGSNTIKSPHNNKMNITTKIPSSNIDNDYKWSMSEGDKPLWYPTEIFSHGHQTYIKFSHNFLIYNTTMPIPLIKAGNDYGSSNFNWRMIGDYMVIDTVIVEAYLKTGTEENGETIVSIKKDR